MARLTFEARCPVRTGAKLRRKHLDGDLAAKSRIAGAIHRSHAARPDVPEDLVVAEADLFHLATMVRHGRLGAQKCPRASQRSGLNV